MKRLLLAIFGIAAASFLLVPPAQAAVNDFVIRDYQVEYRLGRDEERRSILTTKEAITAEFPASDQNHGIERYIPSSYDSHSLSLQVQSVTDQTGKAWNYQERSSGEYKVLRIGDADKYLHGRQTFVITYTQRDVTKHFADKNVDEFYWDTNGTEWRVPIDALSVKLVVDKSLQSSLDGNSRCYQGRYGQAENCPLTLNGNEFSAAGTALDRGENITLAVGFKPGTFAGYQPSLLEILTIIWSIVQGILVFVTIIMMVWLIIRYDKWARRRDELGTIVPEYVPPAETSVSVAASIISSRSEVSAQLIDFAVRHYIKIIETKEKSFWSNAEYMFEIIRSTSDLRDEEQEVLRDIFKSTEVGASTTTAALKKDTGLAMRLQDNPKQLRDLLRNKYGLQQKDEAKSKWFKKVAAIFLVISLVFLSPVTLIVSLVAFIMSFTLWVLTDKGLALYRYLEGLKLYISVAEEERLKLLQSPEGAEKVGDGSSDNAKLVKLYEKVLPYAILFGKEKEWNKRLGQLYESTSTQPDWYTGTHMAAFNAAAFSGAMSSLNTSISSSGASSSSTSGSSGGGSSGGGGGGGGGGGW